MIAIRSNPSKHSNRHNHIKRLNRARQRKRPNLDAPAVRHSWVLCTCRFFSPSTPSSACLFSALLAFLVICSSSSESSNLLWSQDGPMSGKFFHCLCFLIALPRASPSHLPCDLALSPAHSLLHRTVWVLHLQLPLLPNNDQNDRVCPPPQPLLPAT